jgi:hypothetical protein
VYIYQTGRNQCNYAENKGVDSREARAQLIFNLLSKQLEYIAQIVLEGVAFGGIPTHKSLPGRDLYLILLSLSTFYHT